MTQSEAFEANLARGGDACVIRSKLFATMGLGTSPGLILTIAPQSGNLGDRHQLVSNVFSDFRVKQIVVRFLGATNTGTGSSSLAILGWLDDADTDEGDAPTILSDILEMRCSATNFQNQTTPTEFIYRPTDTKLWYKCSAGHSGSDPRWTYPARLFGGSNVSSNVQVELDISIVYKGAVDVSGIGRKDTPVIVSSPSTPVTRGIFSR